MYITCPKCGTHFLVQPEQIGHFGRKVRCSKCANIWHQQLKDDIKLEPVIANPKFAYKSQLGSGINLPALLPIKIPQYLYTLPMLFICLIIILSIILFQDFWGFNSSDAAKLLSINDIHITNNKDAGKITITYKIVNSSTQILPMPLVRVRLFDKNNTALKSHVADQTDIALSPKQSVSIRTEFSSVPDITEKIDITLGSRLAFILR
jgi:predicted Zn finger-like uncharacterized protein